MRVIEKANWEKDVCPICKTKKDGKVVLVGIVGTQDGKTIQARQVHLDCLELLIDEEFGIIYQKYEK